MAEPRRALLLVGSPRAESTSESLGTYLLDRLGERGFEGETIRVRAALRSEERKVELLRAVDESDLVVFAFPLYYDALPAAVTRALEYISKVRKAGGAATGPQLAVIVNNGFPEASQNEIALAICRRFAQETGFEWAGGLALGGGGSVGGKPLKELGGRVRNAMEALDLAATALADGRPIPQEAVELIAKQSVPGWLYRLFGNLGWLLQARKNGILRRLRARPYESN